MKNKGEYFKEVVDGLAYSELTVVIFVRGQRWDFGIQGSMDC